MGVWRFDGGLRKCGDVGWSRGDAYGESCGYVQEGENIMFHMIIRRSVKKKKQK